MYALWVSCDKAIPSILRNWGMDAMDISTPSRSFVASAFAWIWAADVSDNVSTSPASFFVLLLDLSRDHSNKWIISFDQTTLIAVLAECSGLEGKPASRFRASCGFYQVFIVISFPINPDQLPSPCWTKATPQHDYTTAMFHCGDGALGSRSFSSMHFWWPFCPSDGFKIKAAWMPFAFRWILKANGCAGFYLGLSEWMGWSYLQCFVFVLHKIPIKYIKVWCRKDQDVWMLCKALELMVSGTAPTTTPHYAAAVYVRLRRPSRCALFAFWE